MGSCSWGKVNTNAGVGQTAMSEDHNADDPAGSNDSINRRRFVKSLGTAGGAVALGSLGPTRVSAENGDTFNADQAINRATGGEARRSIATAQTASEFRVLYNYLLEEYRHTTEINSAQVVEIRNEDRAASHVVSFKTSHIGSPNEQSAAEGNMAITLTDGEVTAASASLYYTDNDNKPTRVLRFDVVDGIVQKESAEVPISTDESSTESSSTIRPFAYDSLECKACMLIYEAVIVVGCGLGTHAICVAAGVGSLGPGGVACEAAALAICQLIDKIGDRGKKPACTHLNYCDPFIYPGGPGTGIQSS